MPPRSFSRSARFLGPLLAAALACHERAPAPATGPPPPDESATLAAVRSVTVAPARVTLAAGTATLSAILRDSAGHVLPGRAVVWTVADSMVAVVADDGLVYGRHPGETTVAATSEGVRGEATVVVPPPPPAAGVELRPDSMAVEVGKTWSPFLALLDSAGDDLASWGGPSPVWTSADTTVATVTQTGVLRGVAPGRTTVAVAAAGYTATAVVEVFATRPVGTITLLPETTTVRVGDPAHLALTVTDVAGRPLLDRPLSWSTSDERLARVVDASPYFATLATSAAGTVTVTATRDGARATATLRIVPRPTVARLAVLAESASVTVGRTVYLGAIARDAAGAHVDMPLVWRLARPADSAVVRVAYDHGAVTALAPGAARLVVEAGGLADTMTVVAVPPVPLPLASVAAGSRHTCGISPRGVAFCWGMGPFGALGGGALADSGGHPIPALVATDRGFDALAAGQLHTCALDGTGAAWCWGSNARGELGAGPDAPSEPCSVYGGGPPCSTVPVAVAGGLRFRHVAAGGATTCALTDAERAWCWGDGASGQLGAGQARGSDVPVAVGGDHRFSALAVGGAHVCALAADGAPWCWGSNASGQLGASTTDICPTPGGRIAGCAPSPHPVAGGVAFTAIAAGGDHSCALTPAGAAWCWGANDAGQLGDGTRRPSDRPVAVAGGVRFAALVAGGAHTCGLAAGGVAWCWGSNEHGELGAGTTAPRATTPVRVATSVAFASFAAGGAHSCGVTPAGAVHCWGSGDLGQLGTGAPVPPQRAPGPVVGAP